MANTKSAKKALKQSHKRALENASWRNKIKALFRVLKTKASNADILEEQYKELQSVLDKAAKNNVIHRNKAARLKSRAAKAADARIHTTRPAKSESAPARKPAAKRGAKSTPSADTSTNQSNGNTESANS